MSDFIDVFARDIGVKASLVRLLTEDGWMEVVSSFGIGKSQLKKYHKTPIDGSMFSRSNEVVGESRETFLREIIEATQKGGEKQAGWFKKLKPFFDKKFGSNWREKDKDFWNRFDEKYISKKEELEEIM